MHVRCHLLNTRFDSGMFADPVARAGNISSPRFVVLLWYTVCRPCFLGERRIMVPIFSLCMCFVVQRCRPKFEMLSLTRFSDAMMDCCILLRHRWSMIQASVFSAHSGIKSDETWSVIHRSAFFPIYQLCVCNTRTVNVRGP